MNTFKTEDGDTFKAVSPQDLVEHMRNSSRFASGESTADFMSGFAERLWEWNQIIIQHDTPEVFIADLIKVGYLTRID